MANEIGIKQIMSLVSGNFSYGWNPGATLPFDERHFNLIGSPNCDTDTTPISTSGTNITLSNVTTPGYVAIRNTDSTNYVDIGYDDSGTLRDLIRLKAGEFCMFRIEPTRTIRAQADTATVNVHYMIFEN